jgi:hypothetical protein
MRKIAERNAVGPSIIYIYIYIETHTKLFTFPFLDTKLNNVLIAFIFLNMLFFKNY